jgi:preprotein translocase subunit Sec63
MTAARTKEATKQTVFALAIVFYVILWIGVAFFLHRVFGIDRRTQDLGWNITILCRLHVSQ